MLSNECVGLVGKEDQLNYWNCISRHHLLNRSPLNYLLGNHETIGIIQESRF